MNEQIKTSVDFIDKECGGIRKGTLSVIAGIPETYKTTLLNKIVNGAEKNGSKCLYFSLEMTKEQILRRIKAESTQVIDSIWDIDEIIEQCKEAKRGNGLDLVAIDYIQLIDARKTKMLKNRQEAEMEVIPFLLKYLAKILNVAVVVTSQVHRRCKTQKRKPTLSDLRACEVEFDLAILLHRQDLFEENKKNEEAVVEMIIGKNRINGSFKNGLLLFNSIKFN